MKESLAHALRHTRRQAQATYDKRTLTQKKSKAMRFARQEAEQTTQVDSELPDLGSISADQRKFKPGEFVARVEHGSTLSKPRILLGRVSYYESNEVVLLWYKHINGTIYQLQFDGSSWTENQDRLHSVKVSATKKNDTYTLLTSARTIHKNAFGK